MIAPVIEKTTSAATFAEFYAHAADSAGVAADSGTDSAVVAAASTSESAVAAAAADSDAAAPAADSAHNLAMARPKRHMQ